MDDDDPYLMCIYIPTIHSNITCVFCFYSRNTNMKNIPRTPYILHIQIARTSMKKAIFTITSLPIIVQSLCIYAYSRVYTGN